MLKTSQKTVVVTGGSGFLGSWLCERLLGDGCRVICIDSLISGRLENNKTYSGHPNFSFKEHDVINPITINEPVDEIYNLACPASPVRYQADPIHTFKTSVIGVMNMLELAESHGARLLQASTSEVYGDPAFNPQTETYFGNVNVYGPRACYDEGKRGAETLIHDYHQERNVDTRIARIFNTYGPRMRQDDGRVVSNFIIGALQGRDITIYGRGTQTRSFCFHEDLIGGLMLLMASSPETHHPVNLGNPEEYSVLDLAERVLRMTGSKSRLVYCDLPVDDPQIRRPDITSAKQKLGWTPKIGIEEGLERTIAHFQRQLEGQSMSELIQ
ncbi:UDP-glucose 4-epimerase [Roseovarius gaetbuli]|uniref:UDP-glucuronate decarboxylase n=1 Tax=Roseovarius gaetbuli TaxID=1356575 RepID=A0A1X6Z294_9RHOB|nr:UDP-glucuronic acid decarboxylase family protein [Roseovarius gaetbuli]SLN38371.1 UDP-glucose 4-epimerase [Roseovarius gaetbuli]